MAVLVGSGEMSHLQENMMDLRFNTQLTPSARAAQLCMILVLSAIGCAGSENEAEPGSASRDATVPIDSGSENNDVFVQDGVAIDAGRSALYADADLEISPDMNAPPDLSLGEMYDPMDGFGENERCVLTGFEPETSFVQSTDFGLQHVGIHGDEEHVMLTQIFREFGGPRVPGEYSLDGINYRDCGLCLIAQRDCSDGFCEKTFYADEGRVVITELQPGRFAAQFEDVVFHEVTIDPDTQVSTRLPGGDSWCVDNYSFDEPFEDIVADGGHPDNPPVCLEPVACTGETVPDFELLNCGTGQPMSVRNFFAGANAAILIGASGWCSACSELLPRLADGERQTAESGVKIAYVLGDDPNYQEPSIDYCRRYASDHGIPANQMFIDHNGAQNHITLFSHIWPYPDQDGAIGLPFKAVMDVGSWMLFYSDRAPGLSFPDAVDAAITY